MLIDCCCRPPLPTRAVGGSPILKADAAHRRDPHAACSASSALGIRADAHVPCTHGCYIYRWTCLLLLQFSAGREPSLSLLILDVCRRVVFRSQQPAGVPCLQPSQQSGGQPKASELRGMSAVHCVAGPRRGRGGSPVAVTRWRHTRGSPTQLPGTDAMRPLRSLTLCSTSARTGSLSDTQRTGRVSRGQAAPARGSGGRTSGFSAHTTYQQCSVSSRRACRRARRSRHHAPCPAWGHAARWTATAGEQGCWGRHAPGHACWFTARQGDARVGAALTGGQQQVG